ncbi:ABC transporter substrate-binding protein [Bradyrhizobium sp. Gha]|uniref:ABC transporter substrate-binding protein n=1 Tax=Bradyrhizobium sp. Gha TaxID=1855318 RepID=UPI0008F024E7|nr:ABC transporter substrate-binding protein [Bradyrhizobium sp. Gha]SFK15424.1 putative ABC transport system substrate-binding protein [Bradyrhizobium sp. Gha]
MRRREFIGLVVSSAATLSQLDAQAQQSPVIGILGSSTAGDYGPMIAAFRKGLSESGYLEGKNVGFEYAWADDHYDRLPGLAAQLTEQRVNVILAAATPSALAAKSATTTIPIVFAVGGDPVSTGLVTSLNRPGGNITGAAHINVDTAPKRLELLHELLPGSNSLGLLTNPANPLTPSVESGVKAAAGALGIRLTTFHASTDEEINATFKNATGSVAGLVIGTDPLFTSRATALGAKSLEYKLPAIYQYRDFVVAGGAMSYGGDISDSYYRAGIYAGRILNGERPANLAVQLSTRVELFINLKTTEALGLEPPVALVARADEVIE